MSPPAKTPHRVDYDELEAVFGYRFADRSLLERALTHGSAAAELGLDSNQTLEFLGDAVLDLVISEWIMERGVAETEGELTRTRAQLVSALALADVARAMDLGAWMVLGRGEERGGGRQKRGILADAYEAFLGAVFLDGGYDAARAAVRRHFQSAVELAKPVGFDHKTDLQEITQQRYGRIPHYRVLDVSGPDHAPEYKVAVVVDEREVATGTGGNRKSAEQDAAAAARSALETGAPAAGDGAGDDAPSGAPREDDETDDRRN